MYINFFKQEKRLQNQRISRQTEMLYPDNNSIPSDPFPPTSTLATININSGYYTPAVISWEELSDQQQQNKQVYSHQNIANDESNDDINNNNENVNTLYNDDNHNEDIDYEKGN